MGAERFEGGCLCGRTRYRASGEARNLAYCHCASCRGAIGAPFVAWATFDRRRFAFTREEPTHYRSSAHVVRSFCRTCGTSLTYAHQRRPEEIDLTLASLDEPSRLRPECHIWVSDKLPWVSLEDGLPQFPEWRTG